MQHEMARMRLKGMRKLNCGKTTDAQGRVSKIGQTWPNNTERVDEFHLQFTANHLAQNEELFKLNTFQARNKGV